MVTKDHQPQSYTLRIKVPDSLQSITSFGDALTRIRGYHPKTQDIPYLDLKKVRFISPYGLLGLLLIGKQLYKTTANKCHVIDTTDTISKYLERMNFFKVGHEWFHEPKLSQKHSRSPETKSLLEIQKIGTIEKSGITDVDEIAVKFRKRANMILGEFKKRMDVDFFIKVMSELCTNVYTHSKSNGYVAIQRYNYEKSGFEVVKLSVMDDGIGIKESLKQANEFNFQHDYEYLIKAMEPNISGTKSDRGFGLCEVKSIVEKSQGYLWIHSGNSAILQDPEKKETKKVINIPHVTGTRIAIILAFEKLSLQLDTEKENSLDF